MNSLKDVCNLDLASISKAKRGTTKAEQLAAEGLKYVNFCLPIQLIDTWAQGVAAMGEKPNDRIKALIIKDMKGGL